jgi:hypothetical protein
MVDTTGECWMWRGSTMTGGYGKTHFNGKRLGAHRRAYMLTYGDIPEGMHVCHRCDEPGCVRPEHLFLGTPTDNARDMVAKNRANPPRGSRSGKTHFTEDDVREIRRRYAAGDISQAHLARAFGVAPTTIRQIVTRRRWAHLD